MSIIELEERWGRQPRHLARPNLRHPLMHGMQSLITTINGAPFDVINRVRLQPSGNTGVNHAYPNGSAATTGSGSGDVWFSTLPKKQFAGNNKGSIWALFYSTVSNTTRKRVVRYASSTSGSIYYIDVANGTANAIIGGTQVTGGIFPAAEVTSFTPSANTLYSLLSTRNSTAQFNYVNGQSVAVSVSPSSSNTAADVDQIYLGNNNSAAPLQGGVIACALWNRELSADEAVLLEREMWQLFEPRRIWVPVAAAGGGTDLVVQDSTHGHTVDTFALTAGSYLAVADATHSLTIDGLTLTSDSLLTVAESTHAHTVDNITLFLAGNESLVVADADHAHTVDALTLTADAYLTVADSLHAHTVDNVVLSIAGVDTLVVADSTHALTIDGLTLTAESLLAVQDALHAHTVDGLTLTLDGENLLIAEALHAQTMDGVALTVDAWLVVADATHAHTVDNVVFLVSGAFIESLRQFRSPSRAVTFTPESRAVSFTSPDRSNLFTSPARDD